ncbi:MAG: hypothetical protein P1P84_23025 [Deferrisomatales bacterium]|nr:hypothetical protein [Deferrisomatales bacterium]
MVTVTCPAFLTDPPQSGSVPLTSMVTPDTTELVPHAEVFQLYS